MHKRKQSQKLRLNMELNGLYLSSNENLHSDKNLKSTQRSENEHPQAAKREILPLMSMDTEITTKTKEEKIKKEEE